MNFGRFFNKTYHTLLQYTVQATVKCFNFRMSEAGLSRQQCYLLTLKRVIFTTWSVQLKKSIHFGIISDLSYMAIILLKLGQILS